MIRGTKFFTVVLLSLFVILPSACISNSNTPAEAVRPAVPSVRYTIQDIRERIGKGLLNLDEKERNYVVQEGNIREQTTGIPYQAFIIYSYRGAYSILVEDNEKFVLLCNAQADYFKIRYKKNGRHIITYDYGIGSGMLWIYECDYRIGSGKPGKPRFIETIPKQKNKWTGLQRKRM